MKSILVLLAVLAAAAVGQTWISHYNGNDGWFDFQGPERAMRLNPADFGLESPVEIESLKIWFYWGMGSFTDSVFTFRVYSGDGQSLLFESESLTCPRSYWVYYGLETPLRVDTGAFYIVATARSVNPYAHPYINVDDTETPVASYYGSAGAWTQCTAGEYCFYALVCECGVGVEEGRWLGPAPAAPPLVCRGSLVVPGTTGARLVAADGRRTRDLAPGANDLSTLSPGVYYLCVPGGPARRVTLLR